MVPIFEAQGGFQAYSILGATGRSCRSARGTRRGGRGREQGRGRVGRVEYGRFDHAPGGADRRDPARDEARRQREGRGHGVVGSARGGSGSAPPRRPPHLDTVGRMPLRNRVTPLGDLVADPRGLVYGNRGCLHDADGRIRRPWQVRRWIACRLEFRGRRRRPASREVHRALLPRRGDRARGRASAVCRVPAGGLRPLRVVLALVARRGGRGRDRRAAARRAGRRRHPQAPAARRGLRRAPRRRIRAP